MYRAISIIFLVLICFELTGQAYVIINKLDIKGNKKTKPRVVYREIDLKTGDTLYLSAIDQRFRENEKRVLNTGLFTNANINITEWDTENHLVDVKIELIENWYIYPAPIFELADRNFNVWWNEQGRSLSRVNYGLRINHINFSGNKDAIKLVAQFGYTRKFEAEYVFPYLDKKKSWGFATNAFYSENKEIGYKTEGNKTIYEKLETEKILLTRLRLGARLFFRPNLFFFHSLKMEFHRNRIDDFVATELNQNYFLDGRSQLKFFLLEYDVKYDQRIFRLYPEAGFLLNLNVKKEGLGVFGEYNNMSIGGAIEKYFNISNRLILNANLKGKTNLIRSPVAFANNTALGYGDNVVSGYELYVVDGTDYILYQSSANFLILDKLINYKDFMPLNQFRYMSLKIYLRLNFDSAFVNDPAYKEGNDLNNRWVYGFGPAIDVILFNNFLFQIEYSINDLGEKGIFLHNKVSF